MTDTAAIILAAGKSTRMHSDLPKVLHEICGVPMLAFVLDACRLAGATRLLVVVGSGKQQVQQTFHSDRDLEWVEQSEQKGTGHAVSCCREALRGFAGNLLVLAGDMPLVRRETLAILMERRQRRGDAAVLATTVLDDPTGYGRIIRDEQGRLQAIVEEAECTPPQRAITEVNPSYYGFEPSRLFAALDQVPPKGPKGEIYLTEAVRVLHESGEGVSADTCVAPEEAMGVNNRLDLAVVGRAMQDRIQLHLMNEGVTIVDPDNIWIDARVSIGADTVIYPFTFIRTGAAIGRNCRIGPFAFVDSGESVADGSCVGPPGEPAAGFKEQPNGASI